VPKRTDASIVADPAIADRTLEEETPRMPALRRHSIAVVGVIAALAAAIPVMGADPSPSAGPSDPGAPAVSASAAPSAAPEAGSPAPAEASSDHASSSADAEETGKPPSSENTPHAATPPKGGNPAKGPKAPKADKEPEVTMTVTGTVARTTDGQGRPSITITDGSTTWELSAGPPWYWGDKNPLGAYVGKSVTVAGTNEQGSSELDVATVNGTTIRAPGKPPWAGGPWVVGSTHPGWKPWMANSKPGKGHGAPEKPKAPGKPTASPGS
jgi:hypothetical protein